MPSEPESLRDRTKAFAIRIVRLFRSLPNSPDAQIIGKQILRSGTAVGANYRSACRARSRQEFAARIGIVLEEADETVFWLELLEETGVIKHDRMTDLLGEARQLTAIFTTAQRTAREKR
jgi:four helix bundle protein